MKKSDSSDVLSTFRDEYRRLQDLWRSVLPFPMNLIIPNDPAYQEIGAVHLFFDDADNGYRTSSSNSVVGLAYMNDFCKTDGFGINYTGHGTFGYGRNKQALLFSHELGHNLGADHVSGSNEMMSSSIGSTTSGVTTTTKNAIDSYLSDNGIDAYPGCVA